MSILNPFSKIINNFSNRILGTSLSELSGGGGASETLESLFTEVWRADDLPDGQLSSWSGENGVYTFGSLQGHILPTVASGVVEFDFSDGMAATIDDVGSATGLAFTRMYVATSFGADINDIMGEVGVPSTTTIASTWAGGGYYIRNGSASSDNTDYGGSSASVILERFDVSDQSLTTWVDNVKVLDRVTPSRLASDFTGATQLVLGATAAFSNDAAINITTFAFSTEALSDDDCEAALALVGF